MRSNKTCLPQVIQMDHNQKECELLTKIEKTRQNKLKNFIWA